MGLMQRLFVLAVLFLLPSLTYAAWQGPTEVLAGSWGANQGQFAIRYGDSGDDFPRMLVVSSSGKIVIGDDFNKRIQVFNVDGTFGNLIMPQGFPASNPVIEWPLSLFGCGDSNIYTERNEYTQIYSVQGNLLQNLINIDGGIVSIDQQCNFYTHNPSAGLYFLYSPTGTLLKTYTERPLELGWVYEKSLGDKKYKVTVKYPDKEWVQIGRGAAGKYIRDMNGNLYGLGSKEVGRFGSCGKQIASLIMPEEDFDSTESTEPGIDPSVSVIEEYGSPLVAPNGDVYTWKRTPDKYSIIKWKWVDDPADVVNSGPDAPASLAVAPTPTTAPAPGLVVTWQAALQDPGCVTGYEVSRSTSATGSYAALGMTVKGVLAYIDATATVGQTYYYKVRAASGTAYSPYTNAMSGKRP